MTRNPFDSPEAAGLLKDPNALKALLQSSEAQKLLAMLQQQGDIASAASQAKAGNTSPLFAMLGKLQSSPEGTQALKDLEGKLGK